MTAVMASDQVLSPTEVLGVAEVRDVTRRTEADVTVMQIEAIAAWHRARRSAEQTVDLRSASRESRMDLARRMDVLRTQHRAIVERAERDLAGSVHPLAGRAPLRALIVHRNEWFSSKVAGELESGGVRVVARTSNGAEGVGMVVAEQPDLLVVEDTLPMLSGEEVVRETRRFAPATVVVAQVDYSDRIAALLSAGATTAYTRRVPPADVAADVMRMLASPVGAG